MTFHIYRHSRKDYTGSALIACKTVAEATATRVLVGPETADISQASTKSSQARPENSVT